MNEARREAYLNLIQSLLTCPSKEQNQILQDNSELVDAGLVQLMTLVAEVKRENGNENVADLLTEFASYLTKILVAPSDDCQVQFLIQLLQTISYGGSTSHVIHPLLRDNINLINDNFAAILRNWDTKSFPNFDDKSRRTSVIAINDFSNAIQEFNLGSKASNLEIAIAGYEISMSVFTRQECAENWATIQHNLAAAYLNRIRGEKADNLEMAIELCKAALSVRTRDAFPQDRATTQNTLANAYSERIRGEKADNIEISIAFYEAALSVYTCEAFPEDWAMTQHNLAAAYLNRIRGKKADNIETSIAFCKAALSVYTLKAFPKDWARTINIFANAYRKRIRGEKVDNIEKSIAFYKAALFVHTREAFPQYWAMTQHNLAAAYEDRIRGEKVDNIETSIAFCKAALSVLTRKAFPEYWGMTQNCLGNIYRKRIRGEKADNLETSIAFYQAALSVRTRETFPIGNAETLYNLGLTYGDNSQLPQAYNTFATAIETVESMRSEIVIGGEADRQKLAEEWNRLYQHMVEVCLDMENFTVALEYVERSKTRNLVELFQKARSLPENLQRPPISFEKIRSLLAENEAILQWYITPKGFKLFIITRDSPQPEVGQSSYQELELLQEFSQEYIDDYIQGTDNWKNQLDSRLEKLAQILHIDEIITRLPENCQKLILVPFQYLHLFPLHALTSSRQKADNVETGCLLELFPGGVRYTPSCQLLQLSQRVNLTAEDASPSKFFAIQNPTEDLDFTDIEVETIAKSFNTAEVLSRQNASKAGLLQQITSLQNADIAHFSCHGFFDFLNPEQSALILAGAEIASDSVPSENKSYIRLHRGEEYDIAECLTLTEIFDLQLSKCRLVTLSACETGLTNPRDTTDEYIGLPSGFLYAGATSVLSTLWAVDALSTAILMIKFYELLGSESRLSVAVALRESQLWLRDATVQDLVDWVAGSKLISDERKEGMQDYIAWGEEPENKPYQSPHFWAAFCAIGQ